MQRENRSIQKKRFKRLRRIEFAPMIYLTALAIFAFTAIANMTRFVFFNETIKEYLSYLKYFTIFICILCIAVTKIHYFRYYWISCALISLGLISFLTSGDTSPFFFALFVIAAANIRYRLILSTLMWVNSILLVSIIILAWMGLIPNEPIPRYSNGAVTGTRLTFGFNSPNNIGTIIFSIIICYYFIYGIVRIWQYLFVALIGSFVAIIVDSRGAAIALIIIIVFAFIKQICNQHVFNKMMGVMGPLLLLFPIASYAIAAKYQATNFFNIIDAVSSGRVYYGNYFLSNYGVHPFGQQVELISTTTAEATGQNSLVLDNSYLNIGIRFGIIFLVIVLCIYLVVYNRAYKLALYNLNILIFSIFIYITLENTMIVFYFNPIPLALFATLTSTNQNLENYTNNKYLH